MDLGKLCDPKDQPADFCPRGHGPMWYWPTGGTWACQNVHCGETQPTVYYRTDTAQNQRQTWLTGDRMAAAMGVPRPLFMVNGMGA